MREHTTLNPLPRAEREVNRRTSAPRSCFSLSCLLAELGPVDDGKKFRAFAGAVHREALPVAAESQIGEETSGILVEMQICFALDVEYPRSPLD